MLKAKPKYSVELNNVTKFYNKIIANNNVSLKVKEGEIHGVIGENGAGKSTLMSILFGLVPLDKGYICVSGKEVQITSPIVAEKLGLGMVHQHFKLVGIYNAVENIILGRETTNKLGFINYKKAKRQIAFLSKKYGFKINLNTPVAQLSVGQQQKVEILKLIFRKAKILIFDEPTGVMTPQEVESFLNLLRFFKKNGKTIILISHKLNEIKAVSNSLTILRRGKVVGNFKTKDISTSDIARLMVGHEISNVKNLDHKNYDKVLLEVKNLSLPLTSTQMQLKNINFKVHAGEIVAIAGVEGNGQDEIVKIITGLQRLKKTQLWNKFKRKTDSSPKKTKIILDNYDITHATIRERYQKGLSHVPSDRQKYGLILRFRLKDALFVHQYFLRPFSKYGFISKQAVYKWSKKIITEYDVRGANQGEALCASLSGGNQQKAIIGREMLLKNKVLVAVQPTRGLDVGAILKIHKHILEEKRDKKGVLLISYELPEIMALADRIIVLSNGQITGMVNPKNTTLSQIGKLMGKSG